jgi:ParB-like chromosome segregation protein Spo0J
MANIKKDEPAKPNRALDSGHIRDLVESIEAADFVRAVVVRPIADEDWAPIAGFHRIEAAERSDRKQRGV